MEQTDVPERGEPKKRGRKKVEHYTPSDAHLCIYRYFMDTVYHARNTDDSGSGAVRLYRAERHTSLNPADILYGRFEYRIYLGSENSDGDSVYEHYSRDLSLNELMDYMFRNEKEVFDPEERKESPEEREKRLEEKKKQEYSTFRNTLNLLSEEKRFLVKCDVDGNNKNKKVYYPNESSAAFERFVRMLDIAMGREYSDRYSFLFRSEYFRMCLNKQFVLDTIAKCVSADETVYTSIQLELPPDPELSEEYHIDEQDLIKVIQTLVIPLSGKYPKTYQDVTSGPSFEKFVRLAEEYFMSLDEVSESLLEHHFFDTPLPEKDKLVQIRDSDREDTKKVIDKICSDLEYDAAIKHTLAGRLDPYREQLKIEMADENGKHTLLDVFDADPEGTYREEDPWAHGIPTDENIIRQIRTNKMGPNTKCFDRALIYRSKPERYDEATHQHLSEEFSVLTLPIEESDLEDQVRDYYESMDGIVLPLLALVQFSPNALFYFVCRRDEWSKDCIIVSDGLSFFDYNILTDRLVKLAIKDYFNGRSVSDARYPIRCTHIGNNPDRSANNPTIMTFQLGDYYHLEIAWYEDLQAISHKVSFHPYFEKIPDYSQRVLDIVKMSSPRGAGHQLKQFLMNTLIKYAGVWERLV